MRTLTLCFEMSVSTLLPAFVLLSLFLQGTLAQSGIICLDSPPLIIENEGPLTLTFTRKQGTSGTITATYTIFPLTATTADYGGSSTGTITMNDGDTTASLDIPITNDVLMESTEQFRFMLTGADVGPDGNVLINIQDDDVYSPWTEWVDGTCSTTCDLGIQTDTRDRTCLSPFAATLCVEPLTDNRTNPCNLGNCTVVTDWSEWANSGACSVTCGSGTVTQARNRTCSANCPTTFMGMETRTVACDESPCPVVTDWSEWANSGACSVTCGSGTVTQARNRTCSANCPTTFMGMETRTVACDESPCPVVTDWSEWANSGACSVTCGSGTVTQARNRTCSANCPTTFMGMETRTVACDESPCPVVTDWSEWANSGACSVTS
ncbi:adhesion G protein-coupled receptor B3-like, partial [Haliotis rubra]|uniref:adhesion G protein-coupled receptor B3-like n=1 Tax=Haliotis rubra TaxID=36100 RepID=UPI001EE5CEF4